MLEISARGGLLGMHPNEIDDVLSGPYAANISSMRSCDGFYMHGEVEKARCTCFRSK